MASTPLSPVIKRWQDFQQGGESNYNPTIRPTKPPKVWRPGVSGEKDLRNEVANWYRSLFTELLQDGDLAEFHRRCTVYQQFFMGVSAPTLSNYAKRRLNLCASGIDTSYNHLASNPLELRYYTDKSPYHDFAVAMTRMMKWHDLKTNYQRARAWLEMAVPIFGLAGLLFYPDVEFRYEENLNPFDEMETVPGKWQAIDPRSMYFKTQGNGVWDPEILIIRTIQSGREMDQRYPEVLKREGLDSFPRGPQMYDSLGPASLIPQSTRTFIGMSGYNDCEMMRIWVKNYETLKIPVWFPIINPETGEIVSHDAEEARMSRVQAGMEEGEIRAGKLPDPKDNHHNHHIQNTVDYNRLIAEDQLNEVERQYYIEHIQMHKDMRKSQKPDQVAIVPKHKGGIRYGMLIGGKLVVDGSSGLQGEPRPVAYFPNGMNPESFIPRSNLDNILPLQRDINELIHNWMVYVRKAAFPTMMGPQYMADEKKYPRGPDAFWPILPETQPHQMPSTFKMPPFPNDAKELIHFLINSTETFSGSTTVSRGEPSPHRSSGREASILAMQSDKQFVSQQNWLSEGHTKAAKIRLAQIKQLGDERIYVPAMGVYANQLEILKSDIDLNAIVEVIRVPGNRDVLSENDEKVLRWVLLFKDLGLPIDWLVELMSKQSDTAMAARMSGIIMEKIDQKRQAEMASQGGGQPPGGQPPGGSPDMAMDQGLMNAMAGGAMPGS